MEIRQHKKNRAKQKLTVFDNELFSQTDDFLSHFSYLNPNGKLIKKYFYGTDYFPERQ